ncbi:TonB-dependent receptor [Janthinobacterium sp. J1-1]|uniref:TonB-dependent receptor n=1 Tax=Janthinobacterium sp. J1-1 TaxID=3065910 RepID=UPI00281220A3|nr:TonB-dependent receptor [Janthinobacterium sp. J1-1]
MLPCAALAAEEATLPSVTVTADKAGSLNTPASTGSTLALTLMQTPASVELISREQLEQRGDSKLADAITRAAGISSMAHPGNGGSSLSARGFTDTSSVMRLYDGVRQYGGVGLTFPFDTWSVERIEVLRGPASVIYGDGAIGGVVNVIPKKPTRGAIRNEVQATLGSDNTQRLGLGSGGAIDEHWSYRLDASGNRSDGWVAMGQSRELAFSGALEWNATPDLRFTLRHAQGLQHPMRYFGTPTVNGRQLSALRDKNYNVSDSIIRYDDRWSGLGMEWTASSTTSVRARLYHIDSQRHYRNAETYAYNAGTGLVDRSGDTEILHDQRQNGATATVSHTGTLLGLANQASVGVDLSSSRFQHTNNTYAGRPDPASVDPFNPIAGHFLSEQPTLPRYRNGARQYALFAENRIELTPAWAVIAGLRHDHADVRRRNLVSGQNEFDQSYDNTGWRLGTVFDVMNDLALYAQFARAADPVGGLLMISSANSKFDLSTGKQLEVGLKQSFWGRRGEWTLAAYAIRKNNLLARDPLNPQLRVQVGQRSSRGVEATLGMDVAHGWRLDANASVLRARYDDFVEAEAGRAVSRAGQVPPDVAQQLANAWLSWNFMPGWSASGGARYVGRRYADSANRIAMPAYATADLALRWQAAPDTTVSLRAANVFDKHYFTTAYYTSNQWFNGPGRSVEATVHHRF